MKAILEIEMPDSCMDCKLTDQAYDDGFGPVFCIMLSEDDSECPERGRRRDCPLKLADTTQKGDKCNEKFCSQTAE